MSVIEDGKGTGKKAVVTASNLLGVISVNNTLDHHINHVDKKYYTLTINKKAGAVNNCIGYVKNTDTIDLNINTIYLYSPEATVIAISIVTGTPSGGTAIVPVNSNLGSSNIADGIFEEGTAITGLTRGSTLINWACEAGTGRLLDYHPSFIIPTNLSIGFYTSQAATITIIGLGMNYHNSEF